MRPGTNILCTSVCVCCSITYTLTCVCVCVCVCRSPYGIVPGGVAHDQMGVGGGGGGGGVGGVGGMNTFGENHILLFTIFNPLYPITVVSQLTHLLCVCVCVYACAH